MVWSSAPTSRPKRTGGRRAVSPAVVALTLALSACGTGDAGSEEGRYRGRVLPRPIEKVDFTLTDSRGEPYDFVEETEGKVALLFFGYTHCPDICPVHMANIGAVLRDLPFEITDEIEVVFVTTDPERDTPERLEEWLGAFHSSFVGLRGSREEVNRIERALLLPPSFAETDQETGDVLVAHSANVIAFTPDGLAHLLYPFGTRQADWAHDLPLLVREGWREP